MLLVALAFPFGWKIHQLDFKSTFPNGDLVKAVYASQSKGFEIKEKIQQFCTCFRNLCMAFDGLLEHGTQNLTQP
jgi:hypothetical protein